MKKLEVLEVLKNQMDSFYSLEQVIKIVESIEFEESNVNKVNIEDIEEHIDRVINIIESGRVDIIDRDSAEFGISYDNRIELESINIDGCELRNVLEEIFLPLGKIDENND